MPSEYEIEVDSWSELVIPGNRLPLPTNIGGREVWSYRLKVEVVAYLVSETNEGAPGEEFWWERKA